MMYGELRKHSEEYQQGHHTGSIRAYDDAIVWFMEANEHNPKAKYTPSQIIDILKACKENWLEHCEKYGMGEDTDE